MCLGAVLEAQRGFQSRHLRSCLSVKKWHAHQGLVRRKTRWSWRVTDQIFRFTDERRLAIAFLLGCSAGLVDETRMVKKLERYVARYRGRAKGAEGPSAWITADEALRVREQAAALGRVLPNLDRQNMRRIARYLGEEYAPGGAKDAFTRQGKEVIGECGTLMEDIRSAADRAFEKAVRAALESDERSERAFRELCVNVATVWYDMTSKPLPDLELTTRARRFEDVALDDQENVLWVILNAIGIGLSDMTVQRIITYTAGQLARDPDRRRRYFSFD